MSDIDLLPKEVSETPIHVPENPFWDVFKRFGRDEAIAMVINIIGTAIVGLFATVPIVLALTGPIVEKIGFFPAHFKEALDVYRTTPKKKRASFKSYFAKAFRGGFKSLTEDILIHDPIYAVLMLLGIAIYPQTPVWILAAVSFIIAVFAVSGLEVGFNELRYLLFKKKLKKIGFGFESYYESRFFISAKKKPEDVLDQISRRFNISRFSRPLMYNDIYYDSKIPIFSGRSPKLRLRQRCSRDRNGWMQTAQIVFTRASEITQTEMSQHRFFPIKKEKLFFVLDQKMPTNLDDIKDKKAKKLLKSLIHKKTRSPRIRFEREIANDPKLLVSVDFINAKRPYYLLELKTYKNTKLLKEAMRYVMTEFPVVQTTHSKIEMNRS